MRWRLVVGIVALMACGLAIADIAGVVLLRTYLTNRVDQQLLGPGNAFTGADVPGDGRVVPRDLPCPVSQPTGTDEPQLPTSFVITIFNTRGDVRCQLPRDAGDGDTPNLTDLSAARLAALAKSDAGHTIEGTTDGSRWRVRVVATTDGFSAVAVSLAETDATVRRAELVAAGSTVLVLLLAGAGGLALVRIGLRPLSAIEKTAEAIAAGDLGRRVPPGRPGTEVGRLSASLNSMLSQIEEAFTDRAESEDRLRQFVADASHELRTPLSTIRGHAEMYRQGIVTTPHEVSRLLNRIESESVRMTALVDDLLLLARLDASRGLEHRSVDMLAVATDAVLDAQVQDPARPVVLLRRTEAPWLDAAPAVRGDEARLRQVMANLLSNALRHTPPGTPIEAEVGVKPGAVVVSIIDHGPGISPEIAARVFERFYRSDAGRARSSGGSGLGLSIVASLAEAHGGNARYEPTRGGGSTFIVTVPTAPP